VIRYPALTLYILCIIIDLDGTNRDFIIYACIASTARVCTAPDIRIYGCVFPMCIPAVNNRRSMLTRTLTGLSLLYTCTAAGMLTR